MAGKIAACQHRRGRRASARRDSAAPDGSGRTSHGGAFQPPGVRAGDRGGDAAKTASLGDRGRAAEDRRWSGGHGGNGARAAGSQGHRETGRGAQGCHGEQSVGCFVR